MSLVHRRPFLGSPGVRHKLRTAAALGTASLLGAVCIPAASAAPSTIPTYSAVSTPAAEVNSDADLAALEQLKASYFTAVDAKDWASLRTLFAPDAVVDTRSSFGPIFPSRDPFIVFTALTLALLSTHHVGSDPQITVTSPTTADGVWQLQDDLNVANLIGIHGFAHYSDTYEKVGDKWVVATSTLHRTRLDLVFLPGLANISFTIFDVNSENPLVRAISRAIQGLVAPTDATPVTSALTTSAPALIPETPAAPTLTAAPPTPTTPTVAKKVKSPADERTEPVTAAASATEETPSGADDSDGIATKPKDAEHPKVVQGPDSTTETPSGSDDSNGTATKPKDPDPATTTPNGSDDSSDSPSATKPKDAEHGDGAAEPKKAAEGT